MARKKKNFLRLSIIALLIIFSGYVGYKFGDKILYILNKLSDNEKNDFDEFFAQWNVFGIDISEYQGEIN